MSNLLERTIDKLLLIKNHKTKLKEGIDDLINDKPTPGPEPTPTPTPTDPYVNGVTFYLNAETGSDDNDGVTASTPLKTWQKIREIIGSKANFDDYTLSIQSNITEAINTSGKRNVIIRSDPNYTINALNISDVENLKITGITSTNVVMIENVKSAYLQWIFYTTLETKNINVLHSRSIFPNSQASHNVMTCNNVLNISILESGIKSFNATHTNVTFSKVNFIKSTQACVYTNGLCNVYIDNRCTFETEAQILSCEDTECYVDITSHAPITCNSYNPIIIRGSGILHLNKGFVDAISTTLPYKVFVFDLATAYLRSPSTGLVKKTSNFN